MALGDYAEDSFTHEGKTRRVYRRGDGPAVAVIAEIPGIHPGVLGFADRVVDLGCTAVLPDLFGKAGAPVTTGYALRSVAYGCVSREFSTWLTGRTSPVVAWLRALARYEHERCGGPGVGAVGMCFTGGFALGMAVDEVMLAPVLSQPSLPFPVSKRHKRDLGVGDADLARVKERAAGGLEVLGLRFSCDNVAPGERFARLRAELGDAFVGVEIDSAPDNRHGIRKRAHSVLTEDLVDEPGHPTRDALDQVLDLFRRRLLAEGPSS
ncbi:MAG: dienelactone hydrolase family protein [Acidimicrobiales bacterium]